ncbi:MAG: hypothetical protein ABI680_15725, partial [Chthoniobacteraceae bacterium]
GALAFESILDAADIAAAVVDECDHGKERAESDPERVLGTSENGTIGGQRELKRCPPSKIAHGFDKCCHGAAAWLSLKPSALSFRSSLD